MQQPRSFYRSHRNGIPCLLALAALVLASACAPGTATTLSGVGCADPSCNEVKPETRKVLGCIGEACNEPTAAKKAPHAATEGSSSASQPAAAPGTDSPAPAAGQEDADASSMWDIKVYYESHERP